MSTSLFKAEEWVYVPDSMGRLGQGYYKNRNNPNQTITPAEFEQQRAQPQAVAQPQKEQNINITGNPSTNTGNSSLLTSSSSHATDLTPWDNPLIGEQTATKPIAQTDAQTKTPASTAVKAPEVKQVVAQPQNQSGGGESQDHGFGQNENDNGGNSESSKVICTELVRQGLMRQSERRACTIYALSRLPGRFMIGYQFWAVPYVRLMRKSHFATQLIAPFVRWRTQEVCYRLGLRKSGSFFGKIICGLHDPFCSFMGSFVPSTPYSTLYQQEILS